jgi:arginine exporter protein ArgO
MLALAVMLGALAIRRNAPDRRFALVACGVVALGMMLGLGFGAAEGPFLGIRHYPSVARWDTIELVVFLCALFACLLADSTDRYLWGSLATYAFCVALSVVWFAALSRIDDPTAWSPSPWHVALYRVVLTSVMVALAARCLVLTRRGVRVEGLVQAEPRRAAMLAG